jgi:hypothetical protein
VARYEPGTRVQIRAFRDVGSAKLLDGLPATVIGMHFVEGWVYIDLDENDRTTERRWSIDMTRLVALPPPQDCNWLHFLHLLPSTGMKLQEVDFLVPDEFTEEEVRALMGGEDLETVEKTRTQKVDYSAIDWDEWLTPSLAFPRQ